MERAERTAPVVVQRATSDRSWPAPDVVAVEEPLAIRVRAGDRVATVGVTMRTPGDDHELAVGWLLAEGVLRSRRDVADVSWCVRDDATPTQNFNAVTVQLTAHVLPDLSSLDRHGLVSSACGVCGRATLDALEAAGLRRVEDDLRVGLDVLTSLPARLRAGQPTFDETGGLHAAGRADAAGALLDVREDVGRHNAVDKLLGAALLDGDLPWSDQMLVLSGRASYELLQKAAVAAVPIVAAVGAPSSLAVQVADTFGITLVGFLRDERANVYTHPDRIAPSAPVPTRDETMTGSR